MRYASGLAALLLGLAGCAGIDAHSIPDAAADAKDTGFRYYDTSPFLLVYGDGKGGVKSEVLYLPDTTKKRSIKPYNIGAKNDTTLKFDNGRLLQLSAVVDETVIPVEAIKGLEKVALAGISSQVSGRSQLDKPIFPSPSLFRIVRGKKGAWELAGGPAPIGIRFGAQSAAPEAPDTSQVAR